jgi:hypothetical protein
MVTVAVKLAADIGKKLTLIVHVAIAAKLAAQVGVCPKSPGLVPVMLMLEMVSDAVPEFVSVTVCAELGVPTA